MVFVYSLTHVTRMRAVIEARFTGRESQVFSIRAGVFEFRGKYFSLYKKITENSLYKNSLL